MRRGPRPRDTAGIDERRKHLRSVPRPDSGCEHLHDATTRYDHAQRVLTFLLVCAECGIERVVESLDYEPSFEREPGNVHRLPVRRQQQQLPARRAA